jgi:4-hydroxythreonine-4-phosphate dehydrogenase
MRIGCTIGDCNGIGLEVWAKALLQLQSDRRAHQVHWFLIAHPDSASEYLHRLGLPVLLRNCSLQLGQLRVEILPCTTYAPIRWGSSTPEAAQQAVEALEQARRLAYQGQLDGVVTLPVTKHALYRIGWRYPGQTEFFAQNGTAAAPIMCFVAGKLRLALLTTHIPLRQVPTAVTPETLTHFLHRLHAALVTDFGLPQPRIALLGVNPHAGEEGTLGDEEERLRHTLEQLRQQGYALAGPFAADAYFGRRRWHEYDATVAMYHDQGLVAFKLLAQGRGVNLTLGLPFVRTSPDHGSAYDIAGRGIADPESMRRALLLTITLVRRRYRHGLLPLAAAGNAG